MDGEEGREREKGAAEEQEKTENYTVVDKIPRQSLGFMLQLKLLKSF